MAQNRDLRHYWIPSWAKIGSELEQIKAQNDSITGWPLLF